jgi:uncharacterized membrane protein
VTVNKLLIALVGAAAFGVQEALTDGAVTTQEWVYLLALVLAAFGAWLVPNTPALDAAKTWVHALVQGVLVLQMALPSGVTAAELTSIVIMVLSTAGVYLVPNRPTLTGDPTTPA